LHKRLGVAAAFGGEAGEIGLQVRGELYFHWALTIAHDPAARVRKHCQDIGRSKPSMLQDIERGRPTEIDAINGAIVREGARLGVPTPYNRALLLLVKARQEVSAQPA
jgi:ketopantoate reductase